MAPPIVDTAKPAVLRIVQANAGESLVVALPLPSGRSAPHRSSPSNSVTIAASMPTHDRTFWQKFSKSPVLLKISTILRGLGLRQLNSGPGKILFQHSTVDQLADAVTEAAKELPTTMDELMDVATDYAYTPLQEEIAQLLHRFGEQVWSATSERPWLLNAGEDDEDYSKDLVFEEAADKVVLMYYLRLWILVKAFNRTRNRVARGSMPSHSSSNKQQERRVSRQVQDMSPASNHSHSQASTSTQDATKSRARRRPRKTYLSEEIIRNSSDESDEAEEEEKEEDTDLVSSLLEEPGRLDVKNHQDTSNAAEDVQDSISNTTSGPGTGFSRFASRHPTKDGLPKGLKSTRQGRGACKSCYSRHQRCDRVQPTCGRCAELGFVCEFPDATKSTTISNQALTKRSSQASSQGTKLDHDYVGDPPVDNSSPRVTTDFQLVKYWENEDWRLFFQKGDENEIVLATMRSLGLKARVQDDLQSKFSIENFESLGEDVNKIAQNLSSRCSAAQLFYHAEDRTYLDEEIDALFDTHSSIWSLDADRAKLLTPGADENYPEHLFYEESEDQKTLWIHLHRWIFLAAFWNLKQKANSGNANTEETPKPGGSAGSSFKEPRRRNQKRKDSATAPPTQRPVRPLKQPRTTWQGSTSAGHELCTLFQTYLENYTDPLFDELAALSTLEHELSLLEDHVTTLPSAGACKIVSVFVTNSFPAWLHHRTQIVDVKRKLAALQAPASTAQKKGQGQRHLAVLERSRLATQLRQAREAFVQAGTGGLRAEQVIVRAVEVLIGDWEGEMVGLRKGLRGMEEELSALGGKLMRTGGAKWVMGDFESVDSLDGMEAE